MLNVCLFSLFLIFMPSQLLLAMGDFRQAPVTQNHIEKVGTGFSMYIPTRFNDDMGAHITLDVGNIRFDQLNQTLQVFVDDEGSSLLPKGEPILVVLVVPKGISKEYRESFKKAIVSQLSDYVDVQDTKILIKESFIDLEEAQREALESVESLRLLKSYYQKKPKIQAQIDGVIELTEAHIENLAAFKKRWYQHPIEWLKKRNPLNLTVARSVMGHGKGLLASTLWVSRVGLNPWGFGIAAISYSIKWIFAYFGPEWSLWTTRHKFPLSNRVDWIKRSRFVQWYNSAYTTKSFSMSFLRSTAISYLMRWLTFQSGTTDKHPWSLEFFQGLMGISSMEILSDAGMNVGLRQLMKKGHLNFQAMSYLYWGRTWVDTVMHFLFRSGLVPEAYAVGAVSWSIAGTTYLLGKTLKAKERKYVIISDGVQRLEKKKMTEKEKKIWRRRAKIDSTLKEHPLERNAEDFLAVIRNEGLTESLKTYTPEAIRQELKNLLAQKNKCEKALKNNL